MGVEGRQEPYHVLLSVQPGLPLGQGDGGEQRAEDDANFTGDLRQSALRPFLHPHGHPDAEGRCGVDCWVKREKGG